MTDSSKFPSVSGRYTIIAGGNDRPNHRSPITVLKVSKPIELCCIKACKCALSVCYHEVDRSVELHNLIQPATLYIVLAELTGKEVLRSPFPPLVGGV